MTATHNNTDTGRMVTYADNAVEITVSLMRDYFSGKWIVSWRESFGACVAVKVITSVNERSIAFRSYMSKRREARTQTAARVPTAQRVLACPVRS